LAVVAALVAVVVLDFLVVTVVEVAEEAFEVAVVAVVVEVGELTADEAADEAAADETTAAWLQPAGGLSPQHPIVSGCMPKLLLHLVIHPFSSISRIS
jgi:hypothetical protein